MKEIIRGLPKEFQLPSSALRYELRGGRRVFKMCLRSYISRLLVKHMMDQAKKSPMDLMYRKSVGEKEVFGNLNKYRSLVGSLLYLSVLARFDIAAYKAMPGRQRSALRHQNCCETLAALHKIDQGLVSVTRVRCRSTADRTFGFRHFRPRMQNTSPLGETCQEPI